jgi:hypothetical protein
MDEQLYQTNEYLLPFGQVLQVAVVGAKWGGVFVNKERSYVS